MSTAQKSTAFLLTACLGLAASSAALAQDGAMGTLFPEPFVVEHQLVQTDADGTVFHAEPVRDTYGGSWMVSERADGSRLILDFARREMTEIRPAEGTYWSIGFDRLSRLRADLVATDDAEMQRIWAQIERRLAEKDLGGETPGELLRAAPELVVEELSDDSVWAKNRLASNLVAAPAASRAALESREIPAPSRELLDRTSVRHLRVRVSDATERRMRAVADAVDLPSAAAEPPVLDVWVDASVRLTPNARRALRRLEEDVLGPPPALRKAQPATPALLLAEAREHADGAFPVRTVRSLQARPELPDSGVGMLEDMALSLRTIETFPSALVTVPEGLRQVAHPIEMMLRHAEDELRIRDAMAGGPAPDLDRDGRPDGSTGGEGGSR